MDKRVRFSLAYYLWVFGLILLFQWTFFSTPAVEEIPYSEFLDRVRSDKVADVVLTPEKIYGVMKGPQGEGTHDHVTIEPPESQTPWHVSWDGIKAWFAAEREAARKAVQERKDEIER